MPTRLAISCHTPNRHAKRSRSASISASQPWFTLFGVAYEASRLDGVSSGRAVCVVVSLFNKRIAGPGHASV